MGGLPYLTVAAAVGAVTSGQSVWLLPGNHNLSAGLTVPSGVSLRGFSTQTTTMQMLNVGGATTLLTMGTNTRVEDITMKLTSSGHHTLKGIVFPGTTTANAKLRTSVLTVDNSGAGAAGTSAVTGIECSGTGTLGPASFSYNSLKGITVNVYSDGQGNKRGVLVNNTNIVTTRDINIYVAAPTTPNTATGSYVGVETADAANTGSIQLRTSTVGTVTPVGGNTYTASDILQTNPSIITNPTYLASPGIQVGPGVDLVTKTAGGKAFSAYNYPTIIFFGGRGAIDNQKTGYMWPGTMTFAGGGNSIPDPNTPAIGFRVQQPIIACGLNVVALTGPGATSNASVTVCKNSTGGAVLDGGTALTVTLSGTGTQVRSFYATTVNFNSGDYLNVFLNVSGNAFADVAIQVDCF